MKAVKKLNFKDIGYLRIINLKKYWELLFMHLS